MPYACFVKIRNIRHKGLRRFVEKNDPKGLPASQVEKIRDIITALMVAMICRSCPDGGFIP